MPRSALPGVQAVAACSGHAFSRHTHDQFGIGVIRAGAQVSHSGRGRVEAGPGHVITVNPGEVHDGAPIGDGMRAWQMLYLDPGVIARNAAELVADESRYEFEHPAQDKPDLARDVLALYAHVTEKAPDALACDTLLLRIVAAAHSPYAPQASSRAIPAAIRHARALIDDDPAAALSLADLAAAPRA
ncbi:hypothetical protein G6F31_018741 [Rhizopus arrhizus]|nr:hypothetical protein G6F31_018741 [Rhizopus arrhizus]